MWKAYKTEQEAIKALQDDGYEANGQYWERGEMHVSFARVEIGKAQDGRWLTMHVEHNLARGDVA